MTKNKPSINIPSMINWLIFGLGVVIYFLMQLLLKKSIKNLPCFPSLQSAILFILSTAQQLLRQQNLMKSPLGRYILLQN